MLKVQIGAFQGIDSCLLALAQWEKSCEQGKEVKMINNKGKMELLTTNVKDKSRLLLVQGPSFWLPWNAKKYALEKTMAIIQEEVKDSIDKELQYDMATHFLETQLQYDLQWIETKLYFTAGFTFLVGAVLAVFLLKFTQSSSSSSSKR